MMKQYFAVIFICAVLHSVSVLSTEPQTYAAKDTVNNTTQATVISSGNNSTQNVSSTVVAEGVRIKMNHVSANASSVHHGRENVVPEESPSTSKPDGSKVTVTTHMANSTLATTVNSSTMSATSFAVTKPTPALSDASLAFEVHGDSKIKARKGVEMETTSHESNSTVASSTVPSSSTSVVADGIKLAVNSTTSTTTTTTSTTTTATPSRTTSRPKKPTITIGSDDDAPFVRAPPPVLLNNKGLQSKNVSNPLPILVAHGGEQIISNREHKKPDYALPIVLTILAVPLIAIILTVLYKRGSEWWQHRHYRRMDFLIDGMYNN